MLLQGYRPTFQRPALGTPFLNISWPDTSNDNHFPLPYRAKLLEKVIWICLLNSSLAIWLLPLHFTACFPRVPSHLCITKSNRVFSLPPLKHIKIVTMHSLAKTAHHSPFTSSTQSPSRSLLPLFPFKYQFPKACLRTLHPISLSG